MVEYLESSLTQTQEDGVEAIDRDSILKDHQAQEARMCGIMMYLYALIVSFYFVFSVCLLYRMVLAKANEGTSHSEARAHKIGLLVAVLAMIAYSWLSTE